MELVTLDTEHAAAVRELARQPDVVRFGEHLGADPQRAWEEWIGPADPQARMILGARVDGTLRAVARLSLPRHRRRAHAADLSVLASEEPAADPALDALVAAVVDACDRWLGIVRIAVSCPLDHPRAAGLYARHGFAVETRRVRALSTDGAEVDELGLARIRPGFVPPPALTPPPLVARATGRLPEVTFRPLEPSDGAAMAASMSQDAVLRGTMQNPWQAGSFWEARLRGNDPSVFVGTVAEVEGVFAGAGVLILSRVVRRRHCAMLGMHIATAYQGRGVGRRLLTHLVETSDRMGVRRLELTAYENNLRATRIYRDAGFELEGHGRWCGWVDGTLVDDLVMARLRP